MTSLFEPIRLGDLDLPNRVLMAPLTRTRATPDGRVPTALMAEQYVQRSSAGLILAEATSVEAMGVGYERTPGIWSADQVEGWRGVTKAVHDAGGRIFLQLWHVGRISDPELLGGLPPVSASAIAADGFVSLLRPKRAYPAPRALRLDEIPAIVEAFRQGSENAQAAGFDGVEIHGANGYLLDQFLQDKTNKRDDDYGGPVENRARLHLEVADACISVWGADRVGMHLAPRGDSHDMGDSDLAGTFGYLARELGRRKLAFLFLREHVAPDRLAPALKKAFGGPVIGNEQYTLEQSLADLQGGVVDAVGFGRTFIANPDLPERLRTGAPLNELNPATLYAPGPEGYTDYPFLERALA
ncbi:MAG TPA: alkene reductase [Caulobacteraceae bacterium]|jgi:2,4-dienoyl-CoA reductase-like NADH-dependent reductase (Old Yellow Enzyme family)|nr:alkene reductase [Caulobacteraceae bacterium]